MYRGAIRCGAHKCLVSEMQGVGVLGPWEGLTLMCEKRKCEKEKIEEREEDAGEDM